MPDVFDTLTLEAPATQSGAGDIFDSIELPKAEPGILERFGGLAERGARRALNLPVTGPVTGQDIFDTLGQAGQEAIQIAETPSPFPLQRPFPERQQGVVKQVMAGVANLPADIWNFATSPAGLAMGGIAELGPVIQRAVAAGFTVDQIRQGLHANNLQEGVELALGAGLGAYGALRPKGYIAPAAKSAAGLEAISGDVFDTVAAGVSPAQPEPEAAGTAAATVLPETQSAPSGAGAVYQVPISQIATRPELMQYKAMQDETAGTNEADRITTPYDPYKAGNLLLWEPLNPQEHGLTNEQKYIVANGHHRNAAAVEQNVPLQNAQILRESAGYSARDARIAAAEANIADGKGTVYDAANYIRGQAETEGPDAALDRARSIGARGAKAATIALNSAPDLYASFVNERITPEAAASIANAAPGNAGLQRLGIDRALKGDGPNDVANFLQATQAQMGDVAPQARQVDLFASDDTAIQAAVATAKRAGAIQREIGDQINAVQGAARRPEKAAALGVNVQDPVSVNAKLDQLRVLRERARTWATDPQIRDLAFNKDIGPQDAVKQLTAPVAPVAAAVPAAPPDLNLAPPESDAEMLARQQAEAQSNAALQAATEQKAQLQTGWQQPITGTTGDLGQMGLGAEVGGPEDLFGMAREKPDSPPEIGETVTSRKTGKSYVVSYVDPEGKIYGRAGGKGGAVALGKDVQRGIFGFGPGAAAVGEIPLRAESELSQLHNVITTALKDEPRTASATRRVEVATKAATKAPGDSVGNVVKAAVSALWDAYRNPVTRPLRELVSGARAGNDFIEALKDWQGADQRTSFHVRQWAMDLRRQIPDKLTREAITNYIQADGDAALLRSRADASAAKFRPGYEAALNLTPAQKVVAENVRQYYDAMHRIGVRAGILNGAVENYITQMWKRPNKFTNALMADVQSGRLQKDFKYARKRIFDSFFEGEQAHYEPATKDFSALVAAYDLAFNKSLSARALINSLREAKAADGEPVTRFSGMTQPVPAGDVPTEAYLIRPKAMPANAVAADGRAYRVIDHAALRGWKFVTQEGAALPAYYQADMLVHPDHFEHLNNVLKTSAWRQGPLGTVMGPIFKAGALAKQTRLSLSVFHLDQEGLHGLFHRVNPANLPKIDFNEPKQWQLVRNGLQVSDYSAMELFAEGLRGGGLVSKVPVLGELQNRFNEFLFKDYIPRLKMTMALHAYERNVSRYPNLTPDTIAELTARQANAAFGELNYKLMGRSPTVQDSLRLAVLAPDFLEARSKFVGQALKPYGQEQRTALLLGGAVLYAGARVLNQWLDGDPHWNKLFSVIYNGREYRLRTVMGDVYEAFTDPRRFFYNRFSPWLKIGWTVGSGRDYRGIKLTGFEQLKDALSWFVPIPVGQGNSDQNLAQRLAASAGVSNKPAETPIDRVYKGALKYKESLTDPKIQQEVRRAQQETYVQGDYSRLNRALIMNDKEQAVAEIVALMKDKGKTPIDLQKYYSSLPSAPFTGSRMLDFQWQAAMSAPELVEYDKAVQQRMGMTARFMDLYPLAETQYLKETGGR